MHIADPSAGRAVRARRGAAVALTMLGCAGVIGACGSSDSSSSSTSARTIDLNTRHVAHAIEQSILIQRHVHAAVSCPAAIVQEKGKSFVCIATTHNGKGTSRTPFAVTQQNDRGYVTYRAE